MEIIVAVIGTLAGTVIGWLLNVISSQGSIKIYVNKWADYFRYNNSGYNELSKNIEQTESYEYNFDMDIYNNSSVPKILRDIKIIFYKDKNMLFSTNPLNKSTYRFSAMSAQYDAVEPINVLPKTIIHYSIIGFLDVKDEYKNIWNCNRIILSYKNEHDKIKKVVVNNKNYNMHFDQI